MLTLVSLTNLSCFEESINCTRIVELTNLPVEESFIIHNTGERLNCFCLFVCFLKLTWSLFHGRSKLGHYNSLSKFSV